MDGFVVSPELKYLPSGKAMLKFSMAVKFKDKDKNGNAVEATEWYRFTLFNELAERVNEWLENKSFVMTEGALRIRPYTKADGTQAYSQDVTIFDEAGIKKVEFTGGAKNGSSTTAVSSTEDDIPF